MKRLPILLILILSAFCGCEHNEEARNLPPECRITAPQDGARIPAHEPLTVAWNATDEDGRIARIALLANGRSAGTIAADATSCTLPSASLTPGELRLRLEVTDDAGAEAVAEVTVTLLPEPVAPTCTITHPADASRIRCSEELVIRGEGRDEDGVLRRIVLRVGGKAVDQVTEVPFAYPLPVEGRVPGELEIVLEVEDDAGLKAEDRVRIEILPDLKAPLCTILEPVEGAEFPQGVPIRLRYTASDEDGRIVGASLLCGEQTVTLDDPAAGEAVIETRDLTTGPLNLRLTVMDNDGLECSDEVGVLLNEPGAAPVCTLDLPLAGVAYSRDDLMIRGTGEDADGTIAGVSLTVNGRPVEAVRTLPFDYLLPASELPTGEVRIELAVTDDTGLTGSAHTDITVVDRLGTMTDPRDGKTYRTVLLGQRVWMAENLAYLPQVHKWSEGSNVGADAGGKFYYVFGYVGNDPEAAKTTDFYRDGGVLYNWWAAMDDAPAGDPEAMPSGVRGICPQGWHLPSRAEYEELIAWVDGQIPDTYTAVNQKNINGALRSYAGWSSKTDAAYPQLALGGLELFGFRAYPAGQRTATGGFSNQQQYMFLWHTAFAPAVNNGGYVTLRYDRYEPAISYTSVNRGHSVRCVRDY